ncbi:MAG: hypothetical protein ACP5VR_00105 [Acidimicrobiales bacterium]
MNRFAGAQASKPAQTSQQSDGALRGVTRPFSRSGSWRVPGYRMVNYRRWLPASFAIAAASLPLLPRGLGYDPWSWMVWGRELDHGTLVTSGAASSVKPLPIFVDVLLVPFGGAAADLWLVCARAGIVVSAVLVYHLARMLAGRAAGITAAVGWLSVYQVAGYLALEGMSEPLCAAFVLAAVDAHLGGRKWRAAALGTMGALVRVELSPFVALYGVMVLLRGSRRPKLSAVSLVGMLLLPCAWLLPDAISSGDILRSATRATFESQGGPLLSSHPGLSAISEAAGMMLWPLVVSFALGTAISLYIWARQRRVPASLPLACGALAWVALEAAMVQLHLDTGAPRYMLPGVALAAVVAGVAWAEALRALPRLLPRAKPVVVLAVAWLVIVAAPANAFAGLVREEQDAWWSARDVQRLADELPAAVSVLGGRDLVLGCGTIAAAPLQNPAVAWDLDVPLGRIGITPSAHGVVLGVDGQPEIPARYASRYRSVGTVGPASSRWTDLTTCPPPGK